MAQRHSSRTSFSNWREGIQVGVSPSDLHSEGHGGKASWECAHPWDATVADAWLVGGWNVQCWVEFRKVGRFDSMARGAHEPWGQPACFPIRVSACLSTFIVWFLQRVAVLPCQKKMPRVSQSSGLRPSSFWSVWKGIGIVQARKNRGCTVMLGVCTQHVVASTPSSSSSNSQCRRRTSGRLCQDSWSSSDLASWMGTSSPSWRRLSLQFPWSRCLSSGAAAGPAGIEHRFRAVQCFPPPVVLFSPYLI